MNDQIMTEKKKIIKGTLLMVIVLTLVAGAIAYVGFKNAKKYAEGPKELTALNIEESQGEFVETTFDMMGPYFAETVVENTKNKNEFTETKFYYTLMNDKFLIIQVPFSKASQFDYLATLTEQELAVTDPIQSKGRLDMVDPEIKGFAKELLAYILETDMITDEEYNEFFWPYMMNLDIPSQLGQDNSGTVIKYIGGIYLMMIVITLLGTRSRLARLTATENQQQVTE